MPKETSERVGVIGLGLLGRGIVVSVASSGQEVVACDRSAEALARAGEHLSEALGEMVRHGVLSESEAERARGRVRFTGSARDLADRTFVIESVVEDAASKASVFDELERILADEAVVASNTSAIPISTLQAGRRIPARFVGMHWGEPCHISRFNEIIRGDLTGDEAFERARCLAEACGKEPSLVRRDIRGFVTNRLMYAMLREAFHLLESGVADVETIDRSFRNDMGYWATFAGPFRFLDLTGVEAYLRVAEGLFAELSDDKAPPSWLREMVERGALGVESGEGFYKYTQDDAARWHRDWQRFTWDVRKLADRHPVER